MTSDPEIEPLLAGIRAVCYDLDETLIEQQVSFEDLCRGIGEAFSAELDSVPLERFAEVLWDKTVDMWHMMNEGILPGSDAQFYSFRNALRAVEADLDLAGPMSRRFHETIVAASILIEDAPPVIGRLRTAGIRVGIVTNGYTSVQWQKIRRHRLDRYADFVLVSESARSQKPDEGIFKQALTRAGVPAPEAVFVGDLLATDIAGAKSTGLHAILFDPHKRAVEQRANEPELPQPDFTIGKHTELLALLGL